VTKEKTPSISFRLKSFEILSYSFEKPETDFDEEKIGYQVQFLPGIDEEDKSFFIKMKVDIKAEENSDDNLGSITTLTKYELSNLEKLTNKEEEHVVLPKNLAVTLLSITLSTTRGALAAKSEGNILSKFIMPLINPEEMYESSPLKGEIEIKGS
jgi:hypothetical protein